MTDFLTRRKHFEAEAMPLVDNLYRCAYYVLNCESESQECVQETFARAYSTWQEHAYSRDCRPWLFKIMAEILMTKYQETHALPTSADEIYEIREYPTISQLIGKQQASGYAQQSLAVSTSDDFRIALSNIPDEFKLVIVLSIVEDFTYLEIADIVSINLETVKSRLLHGRKAMHWELLAPTTSRRNHALARTGIGRRRTG